ncbi:MAG: MFS transporter [Pyrinomonadaceae bacterium]|nr:MFS transporter [Pyrinomonadaceae bacterium]MBP6212474.1 MFS transporter [Pyrinomonadaceae bacterium]
MNKRDTNSHLHRPAESEPLAPHIRWALVGLCLSMLMPSLDTSIANAGLPSMATALDASFQSVQWIVLAYLLAITTIIVSVGRLGDLVGRRRLLLFGIGLFTVASFLCGAAPTIWVLIVARALQGLGAAIMMSLTVAVVRETVPSERLGSSIGLLGTMSAIGTSLGPSLGGILIAGFGWRSIFFVNVPIGVLNYLLARRFLPADRVAAKTGRSHRFDIPGTVTLGLTLAAYALAMTVGKGSFGTANTLLLAAGMVGLAAFVLIETRVSSPLINLTTFRNRELRTGLTTSALVSTVMMATLVVGPFYLTRGLGLDTMFAGVALSVGPLFAAIAGVPAGKLVDRFGAQKMIVTGLAGIGIGALAVSLLPPVLGVAGYITPIIVMTSSYALFQAANNTSIMYGAGAEERGVISGMLSLSRNLGLITGASVMGAIFAFASALTETTGAESDSVAIGMRTTFGVATGLIVLAFVAVTASRWSHKKDSRQSNEVAEPSSDSALVTSS